MGRVASVVVDDRTSEELRKYAARALEKAYTKILERGLELLQRGGGEEEEAPVREPAGVDRQSTPGSGSAEPPAEPSEAVKEEKNEVEEEATKKKKRRKKRQQPAEESLPDKEELPAEESKGSEEKAKEETRQVEKDSRSPLPRSPKPSTNPAISLKEKKTKSEETSKQEEAPRLKLKPKAKGKPRRSRSKSNGRDKKDKKQRRSPSPIYSPGGGDRESPRVEVQRLTRQRSWQWDLLEFGRIDQSFHEGRGHLITHLRFLVALAEDSCGLDLFPTRTGPSTRRRTRV